MIGIPHCGDPTNLNYLALLACIMAHNDGSGKKQCLPVEKAIRILSGKKRGKHDD